MASTLTLGEGQAQQFLRLSCAENERLSKELEDFQNKQQLLTDEIVTLRAGQQALENENQGLRTDNARLLSEVEKLTVTAETRQRENDELRAKSEALQRGNKALETEIRATGQEHRLLKTSFRAMQSEKPYFTDGPHSSTKSRDAAKASLHRPEALQRAPGPDGPDPPRNLKRETLVPDQGIDSPRLDAPRPSVINTNSTTNPDVEIADLLAEQNDRQPSAVKVLAFDQEGETYVLNAARYPDGLTALIAAADAVCEEVFQKHPHAKNRGHTSWREFAQATQTVLSLRQHL
ncbi:hypothetical protein LTR56_013562 [Elasticomyces elasticus]|nr:hypothetical protein LTR56_013562 [Elasticomyces elasticus]KAK3651026.1 hypothetical protein LTR22_012274 [Elasticomyces elasticus]KAK4931104.1 hypothetical protein LTR49_002520 [Elasticomyces elasticus]KAK5765572.1 hypothetical protein LTS12_004324 [Elasticomyces elasticus]